MQIHRGPTASAHQLASSAHARWTGAHLAGARRISSRRHGVSLSLQRRAVVSERLAGPGSRDSYSEDDEPDALTTSRVSVSTRVLLQPTLPSNLTQHHSLHTASPSHAPAHPRDHTDTGSTAHHNASSTLTHVASPAVASAPTAPTYTSTSISLTDSATSSLSTSDSYLSESDMSEAESRSAQPAADPAATAAAAARIFDASHVPRWTPLLIAYAPIGVCLAVFRMTCWVLGVLLDLPVFRNQTVISTYLSLLGYKVKWKNLHLLPKGHHVMVSNHTTSADLMVLFQLPQRYKHLITTAMPAKVTATENLPVKLLPAAPQVYEQLARDHEQQGENAPPVHVFPEGGLTNGKGCLQFSRGFMKFVSHRTPVVPVALRTRTPFGIRTHTLTSSFLANLFWISFCPWMEVEAVVLPPTTRQHGEGRGAFVQRVQDQIAGELGVPVTPVTIQQKRQIMKAAARKARK